MTSTSAPVPALVQHLVRPGEGRIAYDVQGSGPLVVLVPGMGDLRSAYRAVVPVLVAAGRTVVTTDLRGHGDSDADFSRYGDQATADDLAALLDELGAPAVVVGSSMAAGSAVLVAAARPELVSGLVLVGPFVRDPAASGLQRLLIRVLMARPWAAAAWRAYLPTLHAGRRAPDFAEQRDAITASLRRPGRARAFSLTTRTTHAAAAAALPSVTAPTLVVMGERDPDFRDPEAEATWIAHALHGEAVVVPEAGHYPHAQQPGATTDAVLAFLDRLDDRA
ncbi:alpha/beta fold hydrolase [Frigoribacterium salinisoli]